MASIIPAPIHGVGQAQRESARAHDGGQRYGFAGEHDVLVPAAPQVQYRVPDPGPGGRLVPRAGPRIVGGLTDVVLQLVEGLDGDTGDALLAGLGARASHP